MIHPTSMTGVARTATFDMCPCGALRTGGKLTVRIGNTRGADQEHWHHTTSCVHPSYHALRIHNKVDAISIATHLEAARHHCVGQRRGAGGSLCAPGCCVLRAMWRSIRGRVVAVAAAVAAMCWHMHGRRRRTAPVAPRLACVPMSRCHASMTVPVRLRSSRTLISAAAATRALGRRTRAQQLAVLKCGRAPLVPACRVTSFGPGDAGGTRTPSCPPVHAAVQRASRVPRGTSSARCVVTVLFLSATCTKTSPQLCDAVHCKNRSLTAQSDLQPVSPSNCYTMT